MGKDGVGAVRWGLGKAGRGAGWTRGSGDGIRRRQTCGRQASKSPHGSPGGRVCRVLATSLGIAAVCQVAHPCLHVQAPQACPGLGCLRVQLQASHQCILLHITPNATSSPCTVTCPACMLGDAQPLACHGAAGRLCLIWPADRSCCTLHHSSVCICCSGTRHKFCVVPLCPAFLRSKRLQFGKCTVA